MTPSSTLCIRITQAKKFKDDLAFAGFFAFQLWAIFGLMPGLSICAKLSSMSNGQKWLEWRSYLLSAVSDVADCTFWLARNSATRKSTNARVLAEMWRPSACITWMGMGGSS